MTEQRSTTPGPQPLIGPTIVDAQTSLLVTYSLHRSPRPQSAFWVVLHHGICHTREQFERLIQALNDAGLHVAMIDQQSAGARWPNGIWMGQYRRGFAAALAKIKEDHPDFRLGIYLLHSMGAFIGEAMQQMNPELRRPTVLLTPIPGILGALRTSIRLAYNHFSAYLRAVVTRNILSLAEDRDRCKNIFFAPNTPDPVVDGVHGRLKHAPFLGYLQLVCPLFVLPLILRDDGKQRLLLTSKQDGIFSLWEYWATRRRHSKLTEIRLRGGHDFFIEHAAGVAELVFEFQRDEPVGDVYLRIDPPHAQAVGPPHRRPRPTWRSRTRRHRRPGVDRNRPE